MVGKREGDQWRVGLAVGGLGAQGRGGDGRKWIPHLLCDGPLAWGIHSGHLVKSSVVREVK